MQLGPCLALPSNPPHSEYSHRQITILLAASKGTSALLAPRLRACLMSKVACQFPRSIARLPCPQSALQLRPSTPRSRRKAARRAWSRSRACSSAGLRSRERRHQQGQQQRNSATLLARATKQASARPGALLRALLQYTVHVSASRVLSALLAPQAFQQGRQRRRRGRPRQAREYRRR